jgi:hypothetical protein
LTPLKTARAELDGNLLTTVGGSDGLVAVSPRLMASLTTEMMSS